MRDLRVDDTKLIKSGHEHKLEKIERILQMYEDLAFVLIGDAGQDDPVIYREVVSRRPGRVRAIYIRTVGSERRNERVRRMVGEAKADDVPMLLVESVEEAIGHARSIGLIGSTAGA
jgi:phosphatidate phosphatase APP1